MENFFLYFTIDKNVYQKATLNNTISKLSSLISSHQLNSIQTRTYHLEILFILIQKHLEIIILKILEIRKNGHFDDILIFLNKCSHLSVKAKKKNCELFYLNKTEVVEITTANLEKN